MALSTTRKTSAHHKKVVGKHHKTTKHYAKAYLPYLPLLAIMAVGILISNVITGPGKVLGSKADVSLENLLVSTNIQRSQSHESALSLNAQLNEAAQAKATDMVARNYWSHDTPDGKQPWTFITAAGYSYQLAGENLAYGFADASAVTTGWMNSPEHRANILNVKYQDVGFGVASSPNYNGSGPQTIVVALYGTTSPDTANPSATNISFTVPDTLHKDVSVLGASDATSPKQIALVQLLTKGQAPWSLVMLSIVGTAAICIFVLRHGKGWHRALKQSEAYVASHPWFDIFVVSVGTLSFIMSKSVGFIR